ncbi:MAG: DUF2474 family protein [Caldimonas sp.]
MEPVGAEPGRDRGRRLWLCRVGWLLLIWAASVAALALVAFGMRLVMGWVGLSR